MKLPAIATLVLVLMASAAQSAAGKDVAYATAGPNAVRIVDDIWTDAERRRDLPLRLQLPDAGVALPVVLFSHGPGGSRDGGREWGAQWASHGFAVIHLQHPGSDESLWKDKPARERFAALREGASLQQFLARIADVKFVVADLLRRQQSGDPIAARLDLDRLGMSGHSFGAITTLYLGGQRPDAAALAAAAPMRHDLIERRFKAFLALSPQARGADPEEQFSAFDRPALLVTGTLDGRPFPTIGASPAQRLVPFEAMPGSGNKFQLVIEDADHMYFNGTRGLRDIGAVGRGNVDFGVVEERGYRAVKAISTAYWAAYLRGDRKAADWLKEGGAKAFVEGVADFKAK